MQMLSVMLATTPAMAAENAAPAEPVMAEETVDALETLDQLFETLASLIHVEGDAIELGDGWFTWDGDDRTSFFREWLVIDGPDVSVGRGWLTVQDGETTIAGWTLPRLGRSEPTPPE